MQTYNKVVPRTNTIGSEFLCDVKQDRKSINETSMNENENSTKENENTSVVSEKKKEKVKLPEVEVAVKFNSITKVDTAEHDWSADFTIMLDWMPSENVEDFVPKVDINNATEKAEPEAGGGKVRKRKDDNHLLTTFKYRTKLVSRFDMREYPFDVQYLTLTLKSARFHFKGKNHMVTLKNPTNYRKGHTIIKNADLLPEWELIKLWGAPIKLDETKDVYNGYEVQICVRREYISTLFNFGFPIFCIGMNSFAAYGMLPDELGSRMETNLTMLLTIVAFTGSLRDELPKVPYFTVLEKFNLAIFFILLIQGLGMWLVAELTYIYCTESVENWFTGETSNEGHVMLTSTEDTGVDTTSGCKAVVAIDKFFLIGGMLWLFGWALWLVKHISHFRHKMNRIRSVQVMDSSSEWGLKDFTQEEMTNSTISCTYNGYKPNIIPHQSKEKMAAALTEHTLSYVSPVSAQKKRFSST